jgi:hypothetical protein|tara:strand:- start:2602 stop:2814 length:213 start_codon:yes stop_codon:yes gene_type:complete
MSSFKAFGDLDEDEMKTLTQSMMVALVQTTERLGMGGGLSCHGVFDVYGAVEDVIHSEHRKAKERLESLG